MNPIARIWRVARSGSGSVAGGRLSLRTHLVALVLAAALPLVLFTLALVARYVDAERTDIDMTLRAGAKDLATALDGEFVTSIAALQALAESGAVEERDLTRFYQMAGIVRHQRGWSNMVLLRPDGTQLLNLLHPLGSALPALGGRPYLREVLATRQPVVSDLYKGSMSDNWMVAVAVPVVRDDTVRHVIVAVIYAPELQRLVSPSGRLWVRALVDRNGIVAARTGAPELIGRRTTPDFLHRVSTAERGTYSTTALDGVKRFGAFTRAPLSGWTAALAVPASTVEGALWRSLVTPGIAGGAMLVLAVLLAWAFGRRIAGEMSGATAAAEALAQGRPGAMTDSRIAEVSRLGAALQTSALLLEQRDQARAHAHAMEAEARREAEAANDAKDRFIATLSHELRTPLTPAVTALALIEQREPLSPAGREYVDVIRRNVQLETQLIDDLLDVTRIARGKLEFERRRVELCSVIDRAIDVCRGDIEARGIQLAVDYGPRPYIVEADPGRLQQVFWNILKNAVKFTPERGCIAVRCRSEGASVRADIIDSGVGIAPSELESIFQPFAQAERSGASRFGGLGLGLAIGKALVQAHGGSIRAASEGEGRGATFSVTLPLLAHGADHGARPGRPEAKPATTGGWRPLRVLLVEDHRETARITRVLLESAGHEVVVAGDMRSALETATREAFDCLISDIGLPDGSGVDLMRALRARGNRLPGVAVSGYGSARDVESTLAAGFAAHLVKPVEPQELLRVMQESVGAAGALRSLEGG